MLMINTVNAIEAFADDKTSLVSDDMEGLIDFRLQAHPSKEAALLLNAMILGLKEMADDSNYSEYIQVRFEEV